jgi:hypothetical protein
MVDDLAKDEDDYSVTGGDEERTSPLSGTMRLATASLAEARKGT